MPRGGTPESMIHHRPMIWKFSSIAVSQRAKIRQIRTGEGKTPRGMHEGKKRGEGDRGNQHILDGSIGRHCVDRHLE